MKKIITLTGVQVQNEALPRVSVSPLDRLIASLPGMGLWLQGGEQFMNAGSVLRDRVNGRQVVPISTQQATWWTQGQFPSGRRALSAPATSSNYSVGGAVFNRSAWSIVFVASVPDDATTKALISPLEMSPDAAKFYPRVMFDSAHSLVVYRGTAAARLATPATPFEGRAGLGIITFSVARGLNIFVNGALVASAATDISPLDEGGFRLGPPTAAHSGTGFTGLLGHLLVLGVDLSDAYYEGYRTALTSALKSNYGIA